MTRHTSLAGAAGLLLATMFQAHAATDTALQAAIQSPQRSAKFAARDAARHPLAELEFFGLRADASVVEVWPGGGYWTEILSPYLAAHGTYTIGLPMPSPDDSSAASFRKKFEGKPGYTALHIGTLDKGHNDVPDASADVVLTFRNVHNWMGGNYADEMFADFFRMLKPGGILGVEEHRGDPTVKQDPVADDGYVRQDYTVALAEKAGFKLVGSSEIDANPKDTKHWPKGVWTLPPTFAMGDVDRAKYAAIGEADNFVLKFQKPAK